MSKELQYLQYTYRNNRPTTSLLNSVFMTTVNAAARTLVSVASTSRPETSERWSASDHLRFMAMMMTWLTVWVLRVLMDHLPLSLTSSSSSSSTMDLIMDKTASFYHPSSPLALTEFSGFGLASTSTALVTLPGSSSDLDLVIDGDGVDEPYVRSLERALSHVLGLMNEIPATSGKYQFAMAMAEKIMEENARSHHVALLNVNRRALASSFARTSARLQACLDRSQADEPFSWPLRAVSVLPLGGYVASYVRGIRTCVSTVMSLADMTGNWLTSSSRKRRDGVGGEGLGFCENEADVAAEKLAEELLWVTEKMMVYGAVEEGMLRWSYASGLASLSLTATPRVQGLLVKISALLVVDLARDITQVPGQVKFRLLGHPQPLFSHARNGLTFPVLTGFEKVKVERAIDQTLSTLPSLDQEVLLSNWLQDFSVSASEWPNLQPAYERWCNSTRQRFM
ncbi:PREDICTED: uncharacterized protein LOC104815236 [Tarenaya hassleriana]|uniref:uncharacterized protein LOC104815236 n=1 Tax=Tarenaya hassleriana TaxID=28532 RepID=UPI00053C25D8|nr:PREDICTED: uncharacterized protein LOC104815236 [Tarenaya hassleriana]